MESRKLFIPELGWMWLDQIQNSTEQTPPGLRGPIDVIEEKIPELLGDSARFGSHSWGFLQKERKMVAG